MTAETINLHDQREINTGLNSRDRSAIAAKLAGVLADTYNLYLKTQYYHWNVTGPHFHSLHEMFESQYRDLSEAVDVVAERIRALGLFTPGTFREFRDLGMVQEDAALPENWAVMVDNLIRDNETLARRCREVMEVGEKAEDGVTHDLMIDRMDFHEKTAWMLRAMTENGAMVAGSGQIAGRAAR